jgi:hypothetical protein
MCRNGKNRCWVGPAQARKGCNSLRISDKSVAMVGVVVAAKGGQMGHAPWPPDCIINHGRVNEFQGNGGGSLREFRGVGLYV